MTRKQVLLTTPIHPKGVAILEEVADVTVADDHGADTLRRAVAGAHGIMVRCQLPDDIFEHANAVQVVSRHGVGVDLIPMDAADARNIPVTNVPGANTDSVAEHAFGLFVMLARGMARQFEHLRGGDWAFGKGYDSLELIGKTLGLLGVGSIGQRIARIGGAGFGMRVIGTKRDPATMPDGIEPVGIDDLFRQSDFLAIACPLNDETRHMVDARLLGLMKPSAFLVNVARGSIIDEAALIAAMRAGQIGGAGIDVFTQEPVAADSPLLGLDNVIVTPHTAGLSVESVERMSVQSCTDMVRVLRGERPDYLVNPAVWDGYLERLGAES